MVKEVPAGVRRLSGRLLALSVAAVFVLSATALASPSRATSPASAIDADEQMLIENIDVENVIKLAEFVSQGKQKVTGTEIDQQTADLLVDKFMEIGLQDVRKEEFAVDVTELLNSDDVGYAVDGFWVLSPDGERVEEITATVYSGCPGTGPDGVVGELVDVGLGTRDEIVAAGDVAGKILLTQREDNVWLWNTMQIFEAEAWDPAAIVMYSVAGDWPLDEAVKQDSALGAVPTFSISEVDAAHLKSLMADGPVNVHLTGDVERYISTAFNVIGVIPGHVHPDEYIILQAHYDNWWISLNDDCTGIGAMLDMAQNIIANYDNDRSIMVIAYSAEETGGLDDTWFNWLIGSYNFVQTHTELRDKIVGCLNLDVISADTQFWFDATPELRAICDQVVRDLKVGNVHPWIQDTWQDSWVFAQVGYPAVHLWAWGAFYDYIYHTDLDTIDYTIPKSIVITEKVYLVLLHRLDSSAIHPFAFQETYGVVSGNIAALKTKAGWIPDSIDFSDVDAALTRYNEARADLEMAISTSDPSAEEADEVNSLILASTRLTNSVLYEVGGPALWDVYYRGTEYVQTAALMAKVAKTISAGDLGKAAGLLSTYTTMSWGQLMSEGPYDGMFTMFTEHRAWGDVCAVELVNVYATWQSLAEKAQTGGPGVASKELAQVLEWCEWSIDMAQQDLDILANGFDAAAAELETAAAVLDK